MTTDPTGVDGFLAGLDDCGITAVIQQGVVTFTVVPVQGAQAGTEVPVGVETTELSAWPAVPPHWVHLPETIAFARTNAEPSSIPGWRRHSRQSDNWGNAQHPTQAYLGHLRAVTGEAA